MRVSRPGSATALPAALLAAICIYCLWYVWPLLFNADDSARLVSVFNSDEAHHMELLREALTQRSLRLDFHGYGHLYFYILLVPLQLLQRAFPISDTTLIVGMRFVSALALLGTLVMVYALGARFFSRTAGLVAALLLAAVPGTLLAYAAISHPDTLQVLLLTVSLYYGCAFTGDRKLGSLAKAAIWAGLSFSAKYSGLFLLPLLGGLLLARRSLSDYDQRPAPPAWVFRCGLLVLGGLAALAAFLSTPGFVAARFSVEEGLSHNQLEWLRAGRLAAALIAGGLLLLVALPWPWRVLRRRRGPLIFGSELGLLVLLFAAAFALTSPYLLEDFRVLKGLAAESLHVSFGHGFAAAGGPWAWVPVLASGDGLGPVLSVASACALLAALVDAYRRRRSLRLSPRLLLWSWTLLYLAYLLLRVRYREPRYLLPILPAIVVLVAAAAAQLLQGLRGGRRPWRRPVAAAAVALALGGAALAGVVHAHRWRARTLAATAESPEVAAGEWLLARFPADARVAYDAYCYVPPQFTEARRSWYWTLGDRDAYDPDLLLTHESVRSRYLDPAGATRFFHGEARFLAVHDYYAALDGSEDFRLVGDFGAVKIYAHLPKE